MVCYGPLSKAHSKIVSLKKTLFAHISLHPGQQGKFLVSNDIPMTWEGSKLSLEPSNIDVALFWAILWTFFRGLVKIPKKFVRILAKKRVFSNGRHFPKFEYFGLKFGMVVLYYQLYECVMQKTSEKVPIFLTGGGHMASPPWGKYAVFGAWGTKS